MVLGAPSPLQGAVAAEPQFFLFPGLNFNKHYWNPLRCSVTSNFSKNLVRETAQKQQKRRCFCLPLGESLMPGGIPSTPQGKKSFLVGYLSLIGFKFIIFFAGTQFECRLPHTLNHFS